MSSLTIIGIDPGTALTGYGIIQVKTVRAQKAPILELIEFGVVKTSKDLAMPQRLRLLHKDLRRILRGFTPEEVALERIFFNTNAKTAMSVGQARGVAMLAAAQSQLPIYEYTALEAKLVLTGYGRASKEDVQIHVQEVLGIGRKFKSSEDNAADALAVAICHVIKGKKFEIGE